MKQRTHYKYELYDERKLVYVGITNDPNRRKQEHSQDKQFTRMQLVGHRSTKESARDWEANRLATYRKNHNDNNPQHNKTQLGDK